jgi:DNA-binding Lrp family transcriptional regulator
MALIAKIFIQIEHDAMVKVVEKLKDIPQIKKLFALTGDYDLLAEVEIESSEELYDIFAKKIDTIEGIEKTNTHIVMKSWEK